MKNPWLPPFSRLLKLVSEYNFILSDSMSNVGMQIYVVVFCVNFTTLLAAIKSETVASFTRVLVSQTKKLFSDLVIPATLSVLASFEGRTNTVRSIGFPSRKAVLTSSEFVSHLFDEITQQTRRRPSLQQLGLSVGKHFSSSKPRAHNLALIIFKYPS